MPLPAWIAGVSAAASIGSSIFGAVGASQSNSKANKAAEEQFKQAEELYEYDWESSLRKYEYAKAAVDLERQTSENIRTYKTELAKKAWEHQNQIREFDYVNKVKQFNRAEEQFEDQRAINTVSSILAQEESTRSFNEAQIANMFQKEDLARDLSKALNTSAFAKAEIQLQRNTAMSTASTKRRQNEFEYQTKSIESAFKSQENTVAALMSSGAARSRGTGRSAGKAVQSVLALAGRQQAQIIQNMSSAEQQYKIQATSIDQAMVNTINNADLQIAQQDNNIDYKRQEHNQRLRELKASMDSAKASFSSNMMKIDRDKQAADMQAHYKRMLEPSLGPEIPKPIELPRSIFLDPLKPVKPPAPRKYAPQTQSAWTTFANAAAGVGNAVGTIGEVGQMAGWFKR